MFAYIKNALSAAGAMLGMGGYDIFAPAASSYPRGYTFRPQSEASKKLHLDRAKAKRSRKAKINHDRVLRGEMDYSYAHLARTGTIVLGKSEVHFGDRLLGTAKRTVMVPEIDSVGDGEYRDKTGKLIPKSDLIKLAAERHVKVYPSWTREKIVEALNAAL